MAKAALSLALGIFLYAGWAIAGEAPVFSLQAVSRERPETPVLRVIDLKRRTRWDRETADPLLLNVYADFNHAPGFTGVPTDVRYSTDSVTTSTPRASSTSVSGNASIW